MAFNQALRTAACLMALGLGTACHSSSPQSPTASSTTAPVTAPPGPTPPAITWQAPVASSPAAGALVDRRPELTVRNSDRSGPVSGVSYRFEVAADASFSALIATGVVGEGAGQTSFRPPEPLAAGTSYVWRVSASDSTGATSPPSTPRAFTTVFLPDGPYRARLVVRSPAWCTSHWTVWVTPSGYAYPALLGGWVKPDIGVDGMLEIARDHVAYFGTPFGEGRERLFDLSWNDGGFAGVVNGAVRPDPSPPIPYADYVSVVSLAAHATGTFAPTGDLRGSLSGRVMLGWVGFPGERWAACQAADFDWTFLLR